MFSAKFDMSKAKNTRAPRTEMDEAHAGVIRALTRVINGLNNDPHNVSFRNRTRDILTTHLYALKAAYQYQDPSSPIMSQEYFDAVSSAENALRERQIRCHRVWTAFKVLMGLVAVGFAAGLLASLVFFTPVAVPAGATAAYAAAAFLVNLKFGITLCSGAIPFFGCSPLMLPMMNKGHEDRALTNLVGKLSQLKADKNEMRETPQESSTHDVYDWRY